MIGAYYNENDPKTAAWLRELIKAGLIADGEVDERSIVDVQPGDLRGFIQCHFFAGIGGWSYALRLARWPNDRHVWTGSCPCQPFSAAGKGDGAADSRHLWPAWFRLIAECRPDTVCGEQVASSDGLGWFDRVSTDLEAEDYAVGAVDLCAPGVGAFHIRQRLWFVAHAMRAASERRAGSVLGAQEARGGSRRIDGCGADGSTNGGEARGVDDASRSEWWPQTERRAHDDHGAHTRRQEASGGQRVVSAVDWRDAEWVWCRDGKWRPVEPGSFPLAHGIPARVGRLRGYGNAIVPAVAAEFIKAYLEC